MYLLVIVGFKCMLLLHYCLCFVMFIENISFQSILFIYIFNLFQVNFYNLFSTNE